jgi:regulation of enolase protein 1 (concanavalin A-like superfamily)
MFDWGEPSDPDGDCKIALDGNALVIDVPATPHGLVEGVGQGNAPRVMREIEGDFTVQVKVCGRLHPTAPASAAKAVSFHAGGFLVWGNKDNYARFVRSGQNRDGMLNTVVAWSVRANGKAGIKPATVTVPEQDVFLRLERRGKQLLASYSHDGEKWTAMPIFEGLLPPKVRVGVVALNSAQETMSARFEGLRFGK